SDGRELARSIGTPLVQRRHFVRFVGDVVEFVGVLRDGVFPLPDVVPFDRDSRQGHSPVGVRVVHDGALEPIGGGIPEDSRTVKRLGLSRRRFIRARTHLGGDADPFAALDEFFDLFRGHYLVTVLSFGGFWPTLAALAAWVLPFGSPKGIRTRYLVARSDPREPIAHRAPSGIVSLRALRLRGSAPRPESPCDSCHPDYAREYLPRTPSETGVRPTILLPNVITRAHDARVPPFGSPKGIRTRYLVARSDPREPIDHRAPSATFTLRV